MKRWLRRLLISVLLVFPVIFVALSYLEDLAETGSEGPGGIIASMLNLPQLAINLATAGGYAGIFSLMLLEAAAFPVPSEIILPLAGYLVSRWSIAVLAGCCVQHSGCHHRLIHRLLSRLETWWPLSKRTGKVTLHRCKAPEENPRLVREVWACYGCIIPVGPRGASFDFVSSRRIQDE